MSFELSSNILSEDYDSTGMISKSIEWNMKNIEGIDDIPEDRHIPMRALIRLKLQRHYSNVKHVLATLTTNEMDTVFPRTRREWTHSK